MPTATHLNIIRELTASFFQIIQFLYKFEQQSGMNYCRIKNVKIFCYKANCQNAVHFNRKIELEITITFLFV